MAFKRGYYKRKRTTYRRFYKRKRMNRRRRFYKKRGITTSQKMIALNGIPNNLYLTMKYRQISELTSSTNTYATRVMRGNSIYDPDYTGTGNTTSTYALWATQYTKYAVWKCKIRATFTNNCDQPLYCYIVPYYSSGSVPIDVPDWQNLPGVKRKLIQANSQGNRTCCSVSYTASTRKITGFEYTDWSLGATMGSNPTVGWFWWIAIESVSGDVNLSALTNIELFYYTKLSERKMYTGF